VINKHDLSTLRILGTVGEPINPEAWKWYYRVIGKERLAIIDTWWQTETGGYMISPLSGMNSSAQAWLPNHCQRQAKSVTKKSTGPSGTEDSR
jgi:acetyl-CoA synthetase